MEGIKEKGLFRRFLDWLNKEDENDIDDRGDINEKAFSGEDAKILAELKAQAKKIDQKGTTMFTDKAKKRAETVKGMKAKVETPTMKSKELNESGEEREQY